MKRLHRISGDFYCYRIVYEVRSVVYRFKKEKNRTDSPKTVCLRNLFKSHETLFIFVLIKHGEHCFLIKRNYF